MTQTVPDSSMEDELREILASQSVPDDLRVTYDDMHGLWGGSILTARAVWLESQVRRPGMAGPISSKRQVDKFKLLELIRLLVALSAWEQRTVDASDTLPVPDESRAYLTINSSGGTTVVWERFNDMQANGRLIRVKAWLESQFDRE